MQFEKNPQKFIIKKKNTQIYKVKKYNQLRIKGNTYVRDARSMPKCSRTAGHIFSFQVTKSFSILK